jgi:hypothetical protein
MRQLEGDSLNGVDFLRGYFNYLTNAIAVDCNNEGVITNITSCGHLPERMRYPL